MKRIYPTMSEDEIKSEVEAIHRDHENHTDDSEKVSIFQAFTDANYRRASWVCACLAVFM
jgi:hypothetical protein